MLYKVVLTFESVDKILKCDHSNISHWAVFSFGAAYYVENLLLTFASWHKIPEWLLKMKATEQYFPVVLFIMLQKVVLTFESVGDTLKFDHSNKRLWALLSFGVVHYVENSLLTLMSKGKILVRLFKVKTTEPIISCSAVYYVVQGGSNFWVCQWNPKVWPFKWEVLSSTFHWCFLLCCTRWF